MSIEIEKKFRLTSEQWKEIEKKLGETEAVSKGERFERNVLYSNLEMDTHGGVLRIRETGDSGQLTFKRALESENGMKTQLEFETAVESVAETEKIIEHIGLKKRLMYEKRRKIWEYFFAEVVLDELPFGFFIEIEGTPEQIMIVQKALGLDTFPVEPKTYPGLTAEFGERDGDMVVSKF